MNSVTVLDKTFHLLISEQEIKGRIKELAVQLKNDLINEDVIFIAILNGSFMFASDLLKEFDLPAQITFVKLASYQGSSSSGTVKRLIGINENIENKTVVILEDIVDTGLTLELIKKQLTGYEPKTIKFATLLLKPDCYKGKENIDYIGFNISNEFIIGYGLDYDGYGRNYPNIYINKVIKK